jgi:integrase
VIWLRRKANKANLSVLRIVKKVFGAKLAAKLTNEDVTAYIAKMRTKKRKDSTISKHLEFLAQAFKLAKLAPPDVPTLEAAAVRTGFLGRAQFEILRSELPEDLRDFALFGFLTGWRKGAIQKLEWNDVRDGIVNLRRENSKNKKPYFVPLSGEVAELIERRRSERASETLAGTVLGNLVFHRAGVPVRDFGKSWATATKKAGCEGLIFHDMRRSAVRNLVRSGVTETVAMRITGHKTRSVFDRYNITSEDDLRDAIEKVTRYNEAEQRKVVSIAK